MNRPFILSMVLVALLPCMALAASWQPLGPDGGALSSLAVSANDPDRVYATGPNGLFRSDNRGLSWIDVTDGLPVRIAGSLAVGSANADRIYLVAGAQIFRSDDGGMSWANPSPGLPEAAGFVRQLDLHPSNDDVIFAAAHTGLFRSDNAGDTWEQVDDGGFEFFQNFAFFPEDRDIVLASGRTSASPNTQAFRSTDGGETWQLISISGLTNDDGPFEWDVGFFMSGQGGRVLARSQNGLRMSDDFGQTWAPPTSAILQSLAQPRVLIDADDPDVWYVGGMNGILYTSDNGETAVTASTGLGPPSANGYMAKVEAIIAAPDGNGIYVGTEHAGFWYSGGISVDQARGEPLPSWTWERRNAGLRLVNIRALAVNPVDSNIVYAAYGDALNSPSDLLWTSINSGSSWSETAGGMASTGLRAIAVDPLTAGELFSTRLYAAGYGLTLDSLDQPQRPENAGIFASTSSGQSWDTLGDDIPTEPFSFTLRRSLVLDPSSVEPRPEGGGNGLSTIYVAGSGRVSYSDPENPVAEVHRIYKSTNFGDTWTPADQGIPIPPFDAEFGFGYQQNIISLVIDPSNPQTLYTGTFISLQSQVQEVMTANGVFKSVDGGANWFHSSEGLPRTDPDDPDSAHWDVFALGVSASNPNIVYVVVQPVSRFSFFPALRDSRVYRSNDGGQNWFSATTGLPGDTDLRALLVDPEDPDVVYVAGQGTPSNPGAVYLTTDGGENWNSYSVGLNVDSVTALGLDGSGEFPVIYAGSLGGVFKITQEPDFDFDGVPDDIEAGAPFNGDGNLDGVPDELQPDVASVITPDNGQRGANTYMTMEILGVARENPREVVAECGRLWNAQVLEERRFPIDRNWTYPFGMTRFEIPHCSGTQVRLIYHGLNGETFDDSWQFRVYAPDQPGNIDTIRWQPLPGAEADGNAWILTLGDGQLGDLRPENGTIWIQGGPAQIDQGEIFKDRFEQGSKPSSP